jgi:hypothetical protein
MEPLLGQVEAPDETSTTQPAIELFMLTDEQRERLAINPRR